MIDRKLCGWDIEIYKDIEQGEDWLDLVPLGITVGAMAYADGAAPYTWHAGYTSPQNVPHNGQMSQQEASIMVDELQRFVDAGYTLVTWNGLAFDFRVLAIESGRYADCARIALNHIDMMFHVVCAKGFGVGLDTVAKTMNLAGKTEGMSGALAPKMWRDGEFDKVLEYVTQDAVSTVEVAIACEKAKAMRWTTRAGKESRMPLRNGWLRVRDALLLSVPDTSWMDDPSVWDRKRFLEWTEA